MRRMIVYDNLGSGIAEVSASQILSLTRREEINGEHSLEITTTQNLDKGSRIVFQDGRGIWREYVVAGVTQRHESGDKSLNTYYCVWSVQADLQGLLISKMPGTVNPVTASTALAAILETQSRWTRGTVTQTTTGGASMYDMSAWSALGVLIDNWGGELDTTIGVDLFGVASRSIDLYDHLGSLAPHRRFDFGANITSITRKLEDAPYYCRISPRGKGEQTESGGFGRKITIESVNDGKDYLEYAPMVDIAKLPNGSGYIYPTLIVENSDCETPQELLDWAQSIIAETLTPKITYDVDVIQAAIEGVDVHGVSLGDVVQVVDERFNGLRIEARIVSMTVDELNERNIQVTIGDVSESFAKRLSDITKQVDETTERINSLSDTLSTPAYVTDLISRINAQISATGGYAYLIPGLGIRTYDVEVADPATGYEASQVVEIRGGAVRIANSKTAQGEWDWKTVFVSGHISAELVTAAQIVTGYIGSAGSTYIDLDNDTVNLGSASSRHVIIDTDGMKVYAANTTLLAHLGYGTTYTATGAQTTAPFFVLGTRNGNVSGYYSFIAGYNNQATLGASAAIGSGNDVLTADSFAFGVNNACQPSTSRRNNMLIGYGNAASGSNGYSFGENNSTEYSGQCMALGFGCTASGYQSIAIGRDAKATGSGQVVINNNYANSGILIVGSANDTPADKMTLNSSGHMWTAGGYSEASDRRLKEHISYLADDAAEFVRNLKPALFTKDGAKHTGFYAQDVEASNPWGTDAVREARISDEYDFAVKSLDYQQLIAPLVAYAQQLEARIEKLESMI